MVSYWEITQRHSTFVIIITLQLVLLVIFNLLVKPSPLIRYSKKQPEVKNWTVLHEPLQERQTGSQDDNGINGLSEILQQQGNITDGGEFRKVQDVIPQLRSPVILSVVNLAYADLLYNLLYSIQRLRIQPKTPDILVICTDKECYRNMSKPRTSLKIKYQLALTDLEESESRAADFGSTVYNNFVRKRPLYVERLLERGLDVLFIDSDIVLVGDPFRYFKGESEIYVQQGRKPGILCAGFYFMRASPDTIRFTTLWYNRSEALGRGDDQTLFNRLARELKENIEIYVLPPHLFGGRKFLIGLDNQTTLWSDLEPTPVEIHVNCRTGHGRKRKLLENNKLWFIPEK